MQRKCFNFILIYSCSLSISIVMLTQPCHAQTFAIKNLPASPILKDELLHHHVLYHVQHLVEFKCINDAVLTGTEITNESNQVRCFSAGEGWKTGFSSELNYKRKSTKIRFLSHLLFPLCPLL